MIPRPNDTTAEAQFPSLFSSQLINANIQSKACDWTHTVNPTFKGPYTYYVTKNIPVQDLLEPRTLIYSVD